MSEPEPNAPEETPGAPEGEPSPPRRRGPRIALAAVSTLLALLVGECAVRVTMPRLDPGRRPSYVMVPGVLGDLEPGQDITEGGLCPPLPIRMTTSSDGFRGTEELVEGDGRERILFTGDSFVEGVIVSDDETLPVRVQKVLRERGRDAVAINAGCAGYTIVDQASYLEDRGLKTGARKLVIGFTPNDFADLRRERSSRQQKLDRLETSAWKRRRLLRRVALLQLVNQARQRMGGDAVAIPDARTRGQPLVDDALRARYAAGLAALVKTARASDVAVHGIIFCDPESLEGDEQGLEVQRIARELFEAEGIPFVSALEVYRGSGVPADQLFGLPHDTHPHAKGYEVLAQPVAELLAR